MLVKPLMSQTRSPRERRLPLITQLLPQVSGLGCELPGKWPVAGHHRGRREVVQRIGHASPVTKTPVELHRLLVEVARPPEIGL
jgi:hypothetical protein